MIGPISTMQEYCVSAAMIFMGNIRMDHLPIIPSKRSGNFLLNVG